MRKEIFNHLLSQFQAGLDHVAPQFQRCGTERNASDFTIWSWECAPGLTFFLMLNIADNDDNFAIEVAWSDDGKYPWRDFPHRFYEKTDLPKCRGRLSHLWVTGKMEYRWAIAPKESAQDYLRKTAARRRGEKVPYGTPPVEELLPRIGPLVEDAIQKLVDYGLPLFRRVAEQHDVKCDAV